jgi:hypothetical protein
MKEDSKPHGKTASNHSWTARFSDAAQGILVIPLVPGTKNPFKDSGGFQGCHS